MLTHKDLLGLQDASVEEIEEILDKALEYRRMLTSGAKKKWTDLRGEVLITLFYENSTRTRTSFELAAKYLGADVVNIAVATSSVQKGESLKDTAKTLDSMKADYIAIRHSMSGAPKFLAENVKASVLNAGDGMHEHPTQALLDLLALKRTFDSIKGIKVAIVGDISHSRVALSDIFGLTKMGADVYVYSPGTMIPAQIETIGAHRAGSLKECLADADAVMGLRIQLERQTGGLFPSLKEYSRYFGVNEETLKYAKPDAVIMHPGPVNRGVELTSSLIDGKRSLINDQVTDGVAVRMAVLKLLSEYREKNGEGRR